MYNTFRHAIRLNDKVKGPYYGDALTLIIRDDSKFIYFTWHVLLAINKLQQHCATSDLRDLIFTNRADLFS